MICNNNTLIQLLNDKICSMQLPITFNIIDIALYPSSLPEYEVCGEIHTNRLLYNTTGSNNNMPSIYNLGPRNFLCFILAHLLGTVQRRPSW